MKTLSAEGLFFGQGVESASGTSAADSRQRLLMDFDWKFFQGHGSDPARDLGFGNDQGAFSKSGTFAFSQVSFDDKGWRNLNLPHDWAVEMPFVRDESLRSHGYKPLGRKFPETSVGWYRKTFNLAAEDKAKRITLDFDGVFRSALVFVNGYFIGRNDNGYAPISFDVSDYLLPGEKNSVAVRVDASFGDGWFYEGAGIYRHIWMTKTDPVHLTPWESVVRSEVKGNTATLALSMRVSNDGKQPANVRVSWKVIDGGGKTVATVAASPAVAIAAGEEHGVSANARLLDPSLWSPDTPSLYTAVISVERDGAVVDAERVSFGVRTLHWDADKGFFLNGQSLKIKGTCNHQEYAGVGAALPDRLQYFRLGILKHMGSNAVRTSHNMPTPEWVEACDCMGMMMMCETRNEAATPEGFDQLATMVRRYRNSPSIILWSIGNEEWVLQGGETGERVGASMVERVHQLDPTRKVTAAINGKFETGTSKVLDVEGFNYNLWAPDPWHKKFPGRLTVGSETASTIATRGVYTTDKLRNWESAYDVNTSSWAETAETWWKFYAERDYLPGGFAWTGFDYRGEPTPYGWPSINSQFGIVDTCGFPKDDYFYYKAWWGKDPVLHLLPHWNWEQRVGEAVPVWVHSNLESVELILNGKSLGSKPVEAARTWSGRCSSSREHWKRGAAKPARWS